MNTKIALFTLTMGVALVGFGCTQNETATNTNVAVEEVMEKDEAMMEEDTMEKDDAMMEDDKMEDEDHSDDSMEKEDDTMEKEEEVMEKDPVIEDTDNEAEGLIEPVDEVEEEDIQSSAPVEGQYVDYEESAVSAAAANGDAVLFFHASWCPTCKALNDDLEASRDDIPTGLTIFKVDYDEEVALKKEYGVTYQHTLVQVDSDGNMITKWSGGNTLESITAKVQ